MSDRKKPKLRSFTGQVALVLTGLQIVQFVFFGFAFAGAKILIENLAIDRAGETVSSLNEEVKQELIVHRLRQNQEAFDFLIYDIIQTKRLEFAKFVATDQLGDFINQTKINLSCDAGQFAAGNPCHVQDQQKSIGAILLRFEGKNLGYVIQQISYEKFRDESSYDWLWKVAAALLLAFAVNMAGLILFFPRRLGNEIRSLQERIRGNEKSPHEFRIRELAQVADALDDAAQMRKNSLELERRAAKTEALVMTTQMFAHDIRKPFALLRRGIEILQGVNSQQEFTAVAGELQKDLHRQELMVGSMLDDMMELGKVPQGHYEAISLNECVLASLQNASIIVRKVEAQIKWQLTHKNMVWARQTDLVRVLTNIFVNALEAIRQHGGDLMISTEQTQNNEISIEITNTNVSIPDDVLPRIFEPFFSFGKKQGTRIGLAAAKKLVTEMAGTIAIRSSKEPPSVSIIIRLGTEAGIDSNTMSQPNRVGAITSLK